jgi:hypothetical protein
MSNRLKNFLTERVIAFALWLFRVQIFLTRKRADYYLKCSSNCQVACTIEAWSKATAGKPVDFDSRLYKSIKGAVDYYLFRSFRSRAEPTFQERLILRYEFAYALHTEAKTDAEIKRHFRVVLAYRLATIIKQYENILRYIAATATTEISNAEAAVNQDRSAAHWEELVVHEKLPKYFAYHKRRKFLLWRLKRLNARVKRDLARNNYLKLDFTASDLSSLVAISGTLLVLLGYLRISLLCRYLGIPHERYFSVADYLASSVSSVPLYLVAAAATVAFWWFTTFAPANAYSVQESVWRQQRLGERVYAWIFHLGAFTCLLIGTGLYLYVGIIEAARPLSIGGMYIAAYSLAHFSKIYFEHPEKVYFFASLVVLTAINGLSGVADEIRSLTSLDTKAPVRTLRFDNTHYEEPAWRVLALTSNFVVLRRQLDGKIHIRNKSDLKSVLDSE